MFNRYLIVTAPFEVETSASAKPVYSGVDAAWETISKFRHGQHVFFSVVLITVHHVLIRAEEVGPVGAGPPHCRVNPPARRKVARSADTQGGRHCDKHREVEHRAGVSLFV